MTQDTNKKIEIIDKETPTNIYESDLKECLSKADEYLNGWKRSQADFINYKKEEANRIKKIISFANSEILLDFFDFIDSLQLTILHLPAKIKLENADWYRGLEYTLKKANEILSKHGVTKIDADDVDFNPELHEIIEKNDNLETKEDKKIKIAEIRSGYKLNDQVIRPARVKVIE